MKTLLAIIITATLSFGCATLESEQTTIDFAGGETTSTSSTPTPTVTNWSGTKQLGSSLGDVAHGISTDSSGNVYVTGSTWGGLDGNTNAGGDDLFVVKYDSDGIKQWTQQLGTYTSDEARGISTDLSGNAYVTGYTQGDLDGNTHTGGKGMYSGDLFVVKYDTNGNKQ